MTDIDSGSLEFMVIAEDCCDVGERKMRDILIKISLDNDVHHRLDLSGEFFEQFSKLNKAIRKKVGLHEFENIEQGITCAIYVNPKEYFELYGIYYETNKKHKGIRKGTKGKAWISTIMLDVFLLLTKLATVQNVLPKNKNKPDFKTNKGTWLWLP